MASFFIHRPIFAWVIAFFIALAGLLALQKLPVTQYPSVSPPVLVVRAEFPGASAQTVSDAVTGLLEQELNGIAGLTAIESTSDATGVLEISLIFAPGTDADLAMIAAQNRVKRAEPRLPRQVLEQGVDVFQSGGNFLQFVSLDSTDGRLDAQALGDLAARQVVNELGRLPGVGEARLFGSPSAMRIWLDPDKLAARKMTVDDVAAAVRAQNLQVAGGKLGDAPAPSSQRTASAVVVRGQLETPEQFGRVILRGNADGSAVRLGDVARLEIGSLTYNFRTRIDGRFNALIGVQVAPDANAITVADAVRRRMAELAPFLPAGVEYEIPYDTSQAVRMSVRQVLVTLAEAATLVFLVMYLFLQNLRYTLIPAIVVPVALLGSLPVLLWLGYSLNVLTLFAMVLAIGILVDDAIVVVENVERIMREQDLAPAPATVIAMRQSTGAITGITLVLVSVFLPMMFFQGAAGAIYRQFAVTMMATMVLSAVLALTLTPALCASLLRDGDGHHGPAGSGNPLTRCLAVFDRALERASLRYRRQVAALLTRRARAMLVYGALVALVALLYQRVPQGFLPSEDNGYLLASVELPPSATIDRTLDVMAGVEDHFRREAGVARTLSIVGLSFSGNGANAGMLFVPLKHWRERGAAQAADRIAARAGQAFGNLRDATVFAVNPPPLSGASTSGGLSLRLQDRGGMGQQALLAARDRLVDMASRDPALRNVRPDDLEAAPQLDLAMDRDRAFALGVSFDAFASTLSGLLGSTMLADFSNRGRQERVIMQADAGHRLTSADLQKFHVRNDRGVMVPLAAFTRQQWGSGPVQRQRYNGYPAIRITGDAAPGVSSGQALLAMEALLRRLPPGFGYEWTGQSLEERTAGAQAPLLLALSMLMVFLVLAALYESLAIPVAVLLAAPLGIVGALTGAWLCDLPNDIFFKVGLIAIIGLSAKNAVMIIEFARQLHAGGMSLADAAVKAASQRLRPILMTSLAFILGVLPLALAGGAGAASQRAIGTGVLGGMIAATVLTVYLVPVFFVLVRGFGRRPRPSAAEIGRRGGQG